LQHFAQGKKRKSLFFSLESREILCVRHVRMICHDRPNKEFPFLFLEPPTKNMATLLDQFKNAVDMMHTAAPAPPANAYSYAAPMAMPMAAPQAAPAAPSMMQVPMQYNPAVSAPNVAPIMNSGKPFFTKKWVMLAIGIGVVALIVTVVLVFKKKSSTKKKGTKGVEDEDDDDDQVLDPRLRGQQQQQQQQPGGFQAPPGGRQIMSIPTLQPIAPNMPNAADMRYTDASLRGGLLPPNTRGVDASMQPTGMGAQFQMPNMTQQPPQQAQPSGGVLPMPPPTMGMQGNIPLAQPMQPQQQQQQPPMNTISQVAATMPQQPSGDPNFTKL
jgi:hypothetical protein